MRKSANIAFIILFIINSFLSLCFGQENAEQKVASLSEMTMHVIPQAHIDLAWWWRYDPETIHVVVKHTLETAFENFEKYPDYTFTFLQVPAIEPMEKYYPELFYKMRYYSYDKRTLGGRIRNPGYDGSRGRFTISSGLWCEVDGSLPCGESLVRQCIYGKRYFKKEFGIDVKTAWFHDSWTHPWTFPQILKKSGMDSYMFKRPMGEGEQMFWWEGPDGSKVFAYKPFKHDGDSLPSKEELDNRLQIMNKLYGVKDDIILIGVGNHGGGAIKADVNRMKGIMLERDNRVDKTNLPARLMFSTPTHFLTRC
jgi:alpha-mannosidase